ncbi:hypothetical protein TESG_02320 [Trichophyton tonsurans CBS 112818]|uniref:Uncharacterized protein n=1 Tax=Trichophyton tonsurans (strain CBS 112818) TaxID=647933 RepID=F2RU18_TRIT1|nr:hypothetical protein TESG_02320 [Trichophyton tonsurans CBS 112818]
MRRSLRGPWFQRGREGGPRYDKGRQFGGIEGLCSYSRFNVEMGREGRAGCRGIRGVPCYIDFSKAVKLATSGSRRGAYKAGASCQAGDQRADPRDDRERGVLQDTQASGP